MDEMTDVVKESLSIPMAGMALLQMLPRTLKSRALSDAVSEAANTAQSKVCSAAPRAPYPDLSMGGQTFVTTKKEKKGDRKKQLGLIQTTRASA
jgi:hypothetical protein